MTIEPNSNIDSLAAYALADLSVPDGVESVSLAQNEHYCPPSRSVMDAVRDAAANAHLYPDPDWNDLRDAIASVHQLARDNILCGAGSMELISALGLSYLNPQCRVLVSEYGYLFTRTVADMAGSGLDIAAERNLCVDVDALLESVQKDTKILFLINPGNPTGTMISNAEIRRLRDSLPGHVLLVVDEAYAEFTDPADNPPVFDLVEKGATVVLRTFSKIYGLAGLRVGWGYFPTAVATTLRKVLNPNNVSAPSQAAAVAAMRDQAAMLETRKVVTRRRDEFADGLRRLDLEVPESHTNFVLMRFESDNAAQSALSYLRQRGILLRYMAGYGLSDCLRATIGSQEQMSHTLETLMAWKHTAGNAA